MVCQPCCRLPTRKFDLCLVIMGFGEVRLQTGSSVIAGQGIVKTPQVAKGNSKIVIDFRKVRLLIQGFGVAGDRVIKTPLVSKDNAEIVIGLTIARL